MFCPDGRFFWTEVSVRPLATSRSGRILFFAGQKEAPVLPGLSWALQPGRII